MKYRHDFHAGNFADAHKHVGLLALLKALQRKEKGFLYVDTHAGRGSYDAGAEAAHGIELLLGAQAHSAEVRDYVGAVREWRTRHGQARGYPGSPLLAAALLRTQDRAVCCELQPADCRALQRALAGQPRMHAECTDGYAQLRALLPATERRALLLIDPPYEATAQDFEHAAEAIATALQRQANAVIALWYPIKDDRTLAPWLRRVATQLPVPTLQSELWLHPRDSRVALNGSGMLIVNPPYEIAGAMSGWLPELATLLGAAAHGGSAQHWLVHE